VKTNNKRLKYGFFLILVFEFTTLSSPDRHRQALAIFNSTTILDPSIARIHDSDIGKHLYEAIVRFLDGLDVPRGLKAVGLVPWILFERVRFLITDWLWFRYTRSDVDKLVDGTIPQRRLLDMVPAFDNAPLALEGREYLTRIIENSLEY
jgi:hydroxyacid-oxoacid transhydrogenase